MDGFNNTFNVTMQAFQLIGEVYNFCYINLQKSNIPIPPLEQVLSTSRSILTYIMSNSPGYIQQLYKTMSQIAIQSNMVGIFLTLLVLYIVYCLLLATMRWMYRLVYGFVKFSLIVLSIFGIAYFAHLQWLNNNITPTDNDGITRSQKVIP